MFIQTEATPNPNTLKFIPGRDVMGVGSAVFSADDESCTSPLAARLFAVGNVTSVFLGSDFISVTKDEDIDWPVLRTRLLAAIMDHYNSGEVLLSQQAAEQAEADSEVVTQIKELLETRVRPAVANDGGDIVFHSFQNGVVYLHMRGACSGCPSSSATLKHGIETMLRYYVPEVQAVEAVR